ncbi:hypothetical protein H7F33_06020 [Pedobacter sp. PAMC26386]|nr:hypothetical protein H7F33_06020 [Pedobacter sp. PAMC26386]
MKLRIHFSVTIYLILLFIIGHILVNLEALETHTLGFAVYLVLMVCAFYFFFSRYSCVLSIENNVLKIWYLMPWNKEVTLNLKSYQFMDYGRGFYQLNSRQKGYKNLFRYPYDTMVFSNTADFKENTIIRVNLRFGQFSVLLNYLKQNEKLKLTDAKGQGGFFW